MFAFLRPCAPLRALPIALACFLVLSFYSSRAECDGESANLTQLIQSPEVLDGRVVTFDPTLSASASVFIFLSAKCPCSDSHLAKLRETYDAFQAKGFRFLGIHSNVDESPEVTGKYFRERPLPFPVLQDERAQLADRFAALKTPHVFVVSPRGKLLFEGGLDGSKQAESTNVNYLRDALQAISVGKLPERSRVRALGCIIQRGSS